MNKKGFVFTLTAGLLLAGAVLLVVLFGGISLFTYVASISLWRLAGIAMLIILGVTFAMGKPIPKDVAIYILVIGLILTLLPFVSDTFNIPLSAMMP